MNLFRLGDFTLRSGRSSPFKIDCDALGEGDWAALAAMAAEFLPPFGPVIPVPAGGIPFAEALRKYSSPHCQTPLIAEDVLTTGASMERVRGVRGALGVCAFARGPVPSWVTPLFTLT